MGTTGFRSGRTDAHHLLVHVPLRQRAAPGEFIRIPIRLFRRSLHCSLVLSRARSRIWSSSSMRIGSEPMRLSPIVRTDSSSSHR
eukprot:861759-Prorocentrum_minimum.AAC.1